MLANTPISARKRWPVTIARMVAAGTVSTARVATDRIRRAAAGRRGVKRSKTVDVGVLDMELLLTRREGRRGVPRSRTWPISPPPGPCGGWWPCRFGGPSGSVRRDWSIRHDRGSLVDGVARGRDGVF